MDVDALDAAVRAGKINVFHRAHFVLNLICIMKALDAVAGDSYDFAWFDIPDKLRADDIKCAGFRTDAVAIIKERQRQRPQTVLIADCVHAVLGHDDERVCPFHLTAGAHDFLDERSRFPLDQVQHDLAVAAALENAAQILQLFFQFAGIDDLAILLIVSVLKTSVIKPLPLMHLMF